MDNRSVPVVIRRGADNPSLRGAEREITVFKAMWNVIMEAVRGVDMAHAIFHRAEASPRTFEAVRVPEESGAQPKTMA